MDWNPAWANAISGIESSGRYGLLGPRLANGDQALGKYQVMASNLPAWTQTALGRALSPQEFLSDPDAQEAVFKHQFGSYVDKYGTPEDAASEWFSGRPLAKAGNASDILGTTVPAYVSKFDKALNSPGSNAINSAISKNAGDNVTPTPPPDYGFMGSLLSNIGAGGNNTGKSTYDLGDAMGNAGASMMALGNPQGAAVLAAMTARNQKTAAAAVPDWKVDPKNGTFYRTNPKTGQLEMQQNPNADGTDKKAKLTESAMKNVGDTMEKYDYLNSASSNAADILDDLNKGNLDLGLLKNGANTAKNVAGMSDVQSRALARYNQFIQQLTNDNLRLNKGVQTEGDAYRELKSIASNGTMYDNEAAKESLQRVIKKSQEAVLKRGGAYLAAHKAAYGDEPFAPYDEMTQGWQNNFDSINGRLEDAKPPAAAPAASASPAKFKIINVRH